MNNTILRAIALCVLSCLACGDDDPSPDPGDDNGRDRDAGAGGRGGSTAPQAGAGGSIIPDLTDLLTPMCNPDAESVTSCGGTDCPPLPDGAETSCTINCCSADNRCGTRSSDSRIEMVLGTTCTPPALPDTRCPEVSLGGLALPGCCTGENTCGQIVANICLPSLTPRACDAPAATEDAGI